MKTVYTMKFKGKLPCLNDYTRACRGSQFAGAQMKRENEEMLGWQMEWQRCGLKIEKPCIVHFRWYEKDRRRDADNIAFAKKFVLDALVTAGILKGDSQKYVVGFTDEIVVADEYGVKVTMEEVEEE